MRSGKFTTLFLVLVLGGAQQMAAQRNFTAAQITTRSGQVIEGFIDDRQWVESPTHILFKKHRDATTRTYYPGDLHSFRVADVLYHSEQIQLDTTPRDIDKLRVTPTSRRDTLFLQVLVQGKATLYAYRNRHPHFFIGGDNQVKELIYHTLRASGNNGRDIVKQISVYKGQLISAFSECGMERQIDKADYREKDLITLFITYNTCVGAPPQYITKQERARVKWGVTAGVARSALSMNIFWRNRWAQISANNLDPQPSNNVTLGATMEIILPKNLAKWSIYSELLYRKVSYRAGREDEYNRVTFGMDASYLKLNILGRYQLPAQKIRPYINIGFSNGFAINHADFARQIHKQIAYEVQEKLLRKFSTYELAGLGGVGINYGDLSLELRYEYGTGMGPIHPRDASTTTQGFYLMLHYSLW